MGLGNSVRIFVALIRSNTLLSMAPSSSLGIIQVNNYRIAVTKRSACGSSRCYIEVLYFQKLVCQFIIQLIHIYVDCVNRLSDSIHVFGLFLLF